MLMTERSAGLLILEICIYKWKAILTSSFTYAVVYGDFLLFLPAFSRQYAGVVRGFIGVQPIMAWNSMIALHGCVRQQSPVGCLKFTFEGWRACTVSIKAVQPSKDQNVVVNSLKAHFF